MKKSVFLLISMFLVFVSSTSCFAANVVAWGDNSYGQCNVPLGDEFDSGDNFISVAAGEYHSLAARDYVAPLAAWGLNDFGQCDVGYWHEDFNEIAAGGYVSFGVTENWGGYYWGNIWASQWQEAKANMLDIASSLSAYVDEHETIDLPLPCPPPIILGYDEHFFNGRYFDYYDYLIPEATYDPFQDPNLQFTIQAENYNLLPTMVRLDEEGSFHPYNPVEGYADYDIVKVSAGKWHNISINYGGSISSWPDDTRGQMHDVPAGNDFVDVSAYNWNSLALRSDGTIVAWGQTDSIVWGEGKEFLEKIANGLKDYKIENSAFPVVGPGNYEAIGLEDSDLEGDFFTSASFSVSNMNYDPYSTPSIQYTIRADSIGGVNGSMELDASWVWTPIGVQEFSSGQLNVPAGNDFIAIDSGGYHCLALKRNGSIVAWGDNYFGQCDVPAGNDFVKISGGGKHSLALRANGSVVAWGDDTYGQVSGAPLESGVIGISAGERHSLAVIDLSQNYYLRGDLDGSGSVDLLDFLRLQSGWRVVYTLSDVLVMAENWLIDCDIDCCNPACYLSP